MSSSQDREASLLALALEKPASERGRWLEVACGQDRDLRERLESLLVAREQREEAPPLRPDPAHSMLNLDLADFTPDEQVGQTMAGRYKLMEKIGEGGYGVVYVAEQQEPVRRLRLNPDLAPIRNDSRFNQLKQN